MRPNFLLLIPIALFAGFVWMAVHGLHQDKDGETHSANVGQKIPVMNLPMLDSKNTFTEQSIMGKKVLVNFFASWCRPCLAEHEFLNALHDALPIPIIGIVYKDKDAAIKKYLATHGNPFAQVALDREGRSAIDWGVTGVPETFLIDANGTILAHHAGPLTLAVWDKIFKVKAHDKK